MDVLVGVLVVYSVLFAAGFVVCQFHPRWVSWDPSPTHRLNRPNRLSRLLVCMLNWCALMPRLPLPFK